MTVLDARLFLEHGKNVKLRDITLLLVISKIFKMVSSERLSSVSESDTFPCDQHSAYQK